MDMHQEKSGRFAEILINDLKIISVLDQGFYNHFTMSPEFHKHSHYELLFAADGTFLVDLPNGKSLHMKAGDFVLIPPNVYHGTRSSSNGSKKLALRFHYTRNTDLSPSQSFYHCFHKTLTYFQEVFWFSDEERINNLIFSLQEEVLQYGIASTEYTQAILTQLYICLLRKLCGHTTTNSDNTIYIFKNDIDQRRLWIEEYFAQYYAQPITEEHMAKEICLSKRQLSRVLQQIYGKSFRQLLIESRLYQAAQLLVTKATSAEEIAFEVGYTSLSGFYSAFRKTFGMTVGQYRRKFQKK